jgi:hypothetical protein
VVSCCYVTLRGRPVALVERSAHTVAAPPRLSANLVSPRPIHAERRCYSLGVLAFSHAFRRKYAHFLKRVMSQGPAVSFHQKLRPVTCSKLRLSVCNFPDL